MQCPRCERRLPPGRDRCLYCGAALQNVTDAAQTAETPKLDAGLQNVLRASLDKLPPAFRADVERALRAGASPTVDRPPVDAASLGDGMAKARQTLECLRQGFDADRIDYDEYRELALQALRQFLDQLDKKTGLDFVLKDLKSSDLGPFVDDAIYKTLCGQVLATGVEPVQKETGWALGMFRRKRK